jgi:hypothetical protein
MVGVADPSTFRNEPAFRVNAAQREYGPETAQRSIASNRGRRDQITPVARSAAIRAAS